MVLPGDYVMGEVTLAKDGVNWRFMNGAKVVSASGAVSHFLVGPGMSFKVTGWGRFDCSASYHVLEFASDADGTVEFECKAMTSKYHETIWKRNGSAIITADLIHSALSAVVNLDGDMKVEAGAILSDYYTGVYAVSGNVGIKARSIISGSASAVQCVGPAQLDIEAGEISSPSGGGAAAVLDTRSVELGAGEGILTIRNARLFSGSITIVFSGMITGDPPEPVGTPPQLRLWNCFLKEYSGTIFSYGGYWNVYTHGYCTCNQMADSPEFTIVGAPLLEEPTLE